MSTIKISDGLLTSFYNQNPKFDILQFNLNDESALSQLNWNGLDRPTILGLLKKYQRLLRLNPDPAVATALLNLSPQPAVAKTARQGATLLVVTNPPPQPNLDSAHAIAAIPETEFVQNLGPSVGGAAIAKQIHQNATNVTAKTAVLWANVQNLVAAPHFRTMLANNVGDDIHQFENFPSYQELFGSLDFCKCEQCQSIFSPAAYFVDLMRLTEEKITGNPNHKIDPDFILNARRPDLAQIPLTCAATNDLVPYLDIVNKVVALKVDGLLRNPAPTTPQAENQAIDRAYYTLATAAYPWTLPFNLPLEQIRSYLGYLKTDLATVYQTFNVVEAGKADEEAAAQIADANQKQTAIREAQLAQVSVARETLGLSIEEYNLIINPKTTETDLSDAYGVNVSENNLGGLANLDTFLKQTGLSRQELHELFYQNLSQQELAQGLAYNLYINQVLSNNQSLQIVDDSATILNLTLPTLDRIHRFVLLAKTLNWSFSDLDWVLTSIGVTGTRDIDPDAIQKLARIKQLQATTNLPLDILCSYWHDIKTIGIGDGKSSQARFDILFNNPQLLGEKPPYRPTYSGNPLYTSQVLQTPDANSKIIAGLQLNLNDLTTLIQAFWATNNSGSNPATINLTIQNLSVLYRHTLLASLLRLPIDQYLVLLRLVTQKDPKESLVFSIDALVSMLENRVWLIASGFNVYELDYILNGNESQFVDKKYKDENIQAFLQTLQALDTDLQPELQASDILDWNGFLGKLNNPAQNSPNPNRYLWSLLSSAVQRDVQQVVTDINKVTPEKKDVIVQALNSILKKPDLWSLLSSEDQQDIQQVVTDISKLTSERKDAIVQALNSILKKPDFYKEPEFSGVVIPVVVKELLVSEEILSQNERQKLNRLLLEASYPQEIAQANIKNFSYQLKEKLIEQVAVFLGSTTDIIKSLLEISGRRLALPNGVHSYIEAFLTRDLSYVKKVIRALSQGLVLNQKLQLTQAEIDSIFSHRACYGINPDSQQATLDNIKSLYTFKQLTKAFNDIQDNLVHYFAKVSAAQFSDIDKSAVESTAQEELAKVTGWDKAQIKELVENHFLNDFSLYNSVTGITKLKKAFDLSQSLGVNISFYESLVALAAKTIATDADWQNYNNAAQSIAEIVKAKHKDSDWETISTKINCALNELKRSALTGFALWKLGHKDSSMNNLRTLSEYLLIDVETTGCASISYIKQAILSVQMYLQRCRINLEPGVTQVEIPEIWWEWMMNYRVWEANRKVFLYPENYIEPNLRKNKTDLFKELESELLQSDITQEAAEAAYHNYFDKLAELAKLRVAATYRYFVPQPDGSKEDTLFVFGKTATEPHSYYYRKCINPTANPPTWTPWSKIDVGINSEYISPAFAFNKLFVFWVEITQNTSSISGNDSQQKTTVKKATIKYTFQTVSQKWVQPQTLSKDIIINPAPDNYSLDTEKLFWKKVYPLTIPEKNSEPEKVLVMFGYTPRPRPIIVIEDEDVQVSDRQSRPPLVQPFQKGIQGYTSTIPAITLTNDLLTENRFLNLNDMVVGDNYCRDFISTRDPISTTANEQNQANSLGKEFGLENISTGNISILTVKNQSGWLTFDNGDEAFLLIPLGVSSKPFSEDLLKIQDEVKLQLSDNNSPQTIPTPYTFTRLTTSVLRQLSQKAFIGGIDHLLTLESQQTPELDFNRFSPSSAVTSPVSRTLDFNGSYGLYFQEIFFHIPFLIANTLNTNQRFAEAQKWYHYIFNPTQPQPTNQPQVFENPSLKPFDRVWRYLPFQGNTLEKLTAILTNDAAISAYNNDPFDPHAIAQLRIGAYEKAIVMKYIDNLLDWGDSLFTQDTWESITQATMLYLLAYDLLGQKPENLGNYKLPKPETFQDIKTQYRDKIPPFLIELEQHVANSQSSTLARTPFNDINAYFCVSENEQFTAYWSRVEDRLYKIRHCQNIQGIARQLALFEPPIDPNQLVRAFASGNVPISVISGLTVQVPHYRFDYILERAKNMTSIVIQLGSSFLSALEKKDAEQLSLLRASQESAILRLIQTTKEKQIAEAQTNLASLNQSLAAANHRLTYYQGLINGGLSSHEKDSQNLIISALSYEKAAAITNTLAAASYLVPNIYGLADGGSNFGAAVATIGAASSGIASTLNQSSSLAGSMAQYQRREEEWQFQLQTTQDDVALITQQINAAQITVDIATAELTAHQKNIEQANEVEDFFKNKFSNQDLYQWMVDRLSLLYFQTFKIARDMALAAQKAYQYELNKDDTYINFDYWDSLKKGLLAGESLMLGLSQLEKSYLEGNERRLEIEKTISLQLLGKQLGKDFLQDLKNGKCQFELTEQLFDSDFPGHYCRQIKVISISIPAVIGPYQNIKATLTQLSDKTLLKADSNGVKYLLGVKDTPQPDTSTVRTSWRRNQKIALSRGINDTGLFELNFRDERYLPFEGTGAISQWELSLPLDTNQPVDPNQPSIFDSLTDVIITLSYTALDGGESFKQDVKNLPTPEK